ncbi:histidine phosphatase family protein [Corynebacterium sp. CCM 9203]|uniref:histidine phosphatase family protein n=1 Tax=Corynebacterium sp. CCM 9203 TaxID=3057615 RepID=UPI0035233A96
MNTRLLLVRHGETSANVRRVLDTQPPGASLTARGETQATAVGHRIADLVGAHDGQPGRLAAVVTSIAVRAVRTGQLLSTAIEQSASLPPGTVPVSTQTGIHEFSAGELEGLTSNDAVTHYREVCLRALGGDPGASLPGGETLAMFLSRFRPVVDALLETKPDTTASGRDVVMVTHATAMKLFTASATGADGARAAMIPLRNTGIVIVEPAGRAFGDWILRAWNH